MGANKGFVVAVTFYISVSFLSYWFYVVLPWRWWESIIGLVHIFFFNLVVFLLLHCYYLAISTPPGIVPPDWVCYSQTRKTKKKSCGLVLIPSCRFGTMSSGTQHHTDSERGIFPTKICSKKNSRDCFSF
eukprot:TRINITY_DN1633_c0_g4_i3.p2 TRINITY_DN1633_c0_g4~~TRINITY_DN1633_c0_g4_i3.p2  ORF type:complete len:152 (+),score=27.61 TRINITY_DN1633_c0_g4_i3:68-457(+)